MLEYIGGIESYDFFINLGSVLGSILLIALYYHKSRSWKKTTAVYLLSLVILQAGMFAGRLVRGRVESGFNYYKAKWKSLYRACTFYYVGISSAVSSDFQRKEKRMAGVSGYSLCFSGFPAHF